MKKSVWILISLVIVSLLLVGCFGPSVPSSTQDSGTSQSDEVSGGTSGGGNTDETSGGGQTGELSGGTGGSDVAKTAYTPLVWKDVKDAISVGDKQLSLLKQMADLFAGDDAPVIALGLNMLNASLYHAHVVLKVNSISAETFDKAKQMLIGDGYPENLIAVSYSDDWGGGISLGKTKDGVSMEMSYDKDAGTIVIGVSAFPKDYEVKEFGVDLGKIHGEAWQCVKEVFSVAGIDFVKAKPDRMMNLEKIGSKMEFTFTDVIDDGGEAKAKIMALKGKYGGDYTDMGNMVGLDNGKCGNITVSAGYMGSGKAFTFTLTVEILVSK